MKNIKALLKNKPARIAGALLSLIPCLLGITIALYYIWGPGEGYFHSDCTDTLLWANASVESGKVFDETFRYAGLLPFSTAMWMIPLIKIFGYGMTAQNIAMSIFVLVFAGTLWGLFRALGTGRFMTSVSVFSVMMILSSSDKLREIMYGHTIYYSLGALILFGAVALFLAGDRAASGLYEGTRKKRAVVGFSLAAAAFAFLCGGAATDGGQIIIIGTLPVIAGIIAERLFNGRDRLISKKSMPAWIFSFLFAAGTVTGIILLTIWKGGKIDSSYANAYSGWSDVGTWADNAKAFVKQWFSLVGVDTSKLPTLFSLESLPAIIKIAGGLIILVLPFVFLVFYKKFESRGFKILLWSHFVSTAAVMFGFICGKLSGANWRLTPVVATSAAVSFAGISLLISSGLGRVLDEGADTEETDIVCESRVFLRIGICLLCAVLLFPLTSFAEIRKMPADYGRDNYNHRLSAFLKEKGLEYGYATFWYSQTITAISDSEVKVREVLADKSRGVYTDYYQSSRNWYTGQNYDRFFILLSAYEYSNVCNTKSWKEMCKYKIEEYPKLNEDGEVLEGVDGFVITVFSVNILDPDEMK